MIRRRPPSPGRRRVERGDVTRERLLLAAIDVFGRYGFDGTTTRALAKAAGVNLQAIPYYFGGKRGLYVAAAEHIGTLINAEVADLREQTRARIEASETGRVPLAAAEARAVLAAILGRMAVFFVGPGSESVARFMIREQMEPTEAFQRVYAAVMGPMLGLVGKLVATLMGEDPASEDVRLRTLSLVGGVLVFRVAHAAVLTHLDWCAVGPAQVEAVAALAGALAASVGPTDRSLREREFSGRAPGNPVADPGRNRQRME